MRRRVTSLLSLLALAAAPLAVLAAAPANAAPTELFFSEYVEGSSNNKALEIYNGTAAPVVLNTGTAATSYSVQMFFNGSATAGLTINLTGTVAAGDVFVLGQSAATLPEILAADQLNGAGWFNGDDAVVLRKGTTRARRDRPDRHRPGQRVGHRRHEHGGQHPAPAAVRRGGRPRRLQRLRPERPVGGIRRGQRSATSGPHPTSSRRRR